MEKGFHTGIRYEQFSDPELVPVPVLVSVSARYLILPSVSTGVQSENRSRCWSDTELSESSVAPPCWCGSGSAGPTCSPSLSSNQAAAQKALDSDQWEGGAGGGRAAAPLLSRSLSCRRSSHAPSLLGPRPRGQSEGETADDELSVPGDVLEEGGGAGGGRGRTYSGSTFSGLVVAPSHRARRRPSTYSTASRGSQVLQPIRAAARLCCVSLAPFCSRTEKSLRDHQARGR